MVFFSWIRVCSLTAHLFIFLDIQSFYDGEVWNFIDNAIGLMTQASAAAESNIPLDGLDWDFQNLATFF